MSMVKSLKSHKDLQGFIDRFDNSLFDCDGVIWHGEELIKGVRTVLELVRISDKKLIFVTNNATKLNILPSLSRLSFAPTFRDEIFGSAYATALCLKRILKFPDNKKVYVIGENTVS
ncbi:uncharacterized protein PGTG_21164 [Puccinia graminis f. sp. tritici CRL 75-36-700-3]|uniref:4-nitrophenylphosphatase n=1 Tax=Puccinia graminis f. sp. tritici (strain CRL 75-36-700-3 / race SCCL) TaxID=418459 RepID=H6QQK4_PUCGT|nr:uncharacterized protein PGTG_21164 [Puccinia graminis f. sp. tritici CRL 75-36-700-3]EHS62656.1 hypothetical protein PGTG_21164 [Puccinia graminis f. sp. tritici CRL 75-36-700-3]